MQSIRIKVTLEFIISAHFRYNLYTSKGMKAKMARDRNEMSFLIIVCTPHDRITTGSDSTSLQQLHRAQENDYLLLKDECAPHTQVVNNIRMIIC